MVPGQRLAGYFRRPSGFAAITCTDQMILAAVSPSLAVILQ